MSIRSNGRGSGSLPNYVDTGESPTLAKLMSPSAHDAKAFNIPRNISVPSTAFSNNQGSYQISPIPFINGTEFLLTMSDATGFGTGGTSELLTVGEPVGSASCNTTNPTLVYSFSLPSSLQQCGYAEGLNPAYLRHSLRHQLLHLQRLRRGHLTCYNYGLSCWTFGSSVA